MCHPDGTIGLLSWASEGLVGALSKARERFVPTPPSAVQPPPLWGGEEHLSELSALALTLALQWDVLEDTSFERLASSGSTSKHDTDHRDTRGCGETGHEAELDAGLDEFCDEWNHGRPDDTRSEVEYLLTVGTGA